MTQGQSRRHLGWLLVDLTGLCLEPEHLRSICVCKTLLLSSCQAFAFLPSCSRIGWAKQGVLCVHLMPAIHDEFCRVQPNVMEKLKWAHGIPSFQLHRDVDVFLGRITSFVQPDYFHEVGHQQVGHNKPRQVTGCFPRPLLKSVRDSDVSGWSLVF